MSSQTTTAGEGRECLSRFYSQNHPQARRVPCGIHVAPGLTAPRLGL